MACKRRILFSLIICTVFWVVIFNSSNYGEGEIQTRNKIVQLEGWDFNISRNTSHYIINNLSAIILPSDFCENDVFLSVFVTSAPTHFEQRIAVRETWGSQQSVLNNNISFYFLLGQTKNETVQNDIVLENEIYGDIIQENFLDSYNNLTLKSIYMVKLVSKHCSSTAKFVMKVDDDVFVNVEQLIRMLMSKGTQRNFIIGKKICDAGVIRNPTNKWYSPRYMYQLQKYPDYLSGTAYVMSADVAEKLYNAALSTPIFHLEDVYLTGICSKEAKVTIEGHRMFLYRQVTIDECLMRIGFTFHEFNTTELYHVYETLKNPDLPQKCATYKENVYKGYCKKPKKRKQV